MKLLLMIIHLYRPLLHLLARNHWLRRHLLLMLQMVMMLLLLVAHMTCGGLLMLILLRVGICMIRLVRLRLVLQLLLHWWLHRPR